MNWKYSISVSYKDKHSKLYNKCVFNCNKLESANDFIFRMKQKYSDCIFEKHQNNELISKFY